MTPETSGTGVIDREPSPLEVFFEAHEAEMEEARAQFSAEHFSEFKNLPQSLTKIHKLYLSEIKEGSKQAFQNILHQIIDEDFITTKENNLRALAEKNGIYEPSDEAGGGDFWDKHEHENEHVGSVGEVVFDAEIVDVAGHGAETLYMKALALRFLEVYRSQSVDKQENLFAELDAFWTELPESTFLDYIEARIIKDNEGTTIELELGGGTVFFFRDNETGMIYQRLPEGKEYGGEAVHDVITPLVFDEYPIIGSGAIEKSERKINRIKLLPNVDVYMLSDGLFELPVDKPSSQFENYFAKFCREHKQATGDMFRKALIEKTHQLRANYEKTGRFGKVDDITVLVLHVADGKVS